MFTPEQAGINSPAPADTANTARPALPPLQLLDKLAIVLLLASGFNCGLLGVFDVDAIGMLLGEATAAAKTMQVAVGLAAVDALLLALQGWRRAHA